MLLFASRRQQLLGLAAYHVTLSSSVLLHERAAAATLAASAASHANSVTVAGRATTTGAPTFGTTVRASSRRLPMCSDLNRDSWRAP